MWLRPPGFSRPPYNHHTGDFGMNCTHGAHTMVCRTTLRSHVCSSTGGAKPLFELRTRRTHVCSSTDLKTQPTASYGPFFCCPMPSSMAFFCHTTPFFGSPESHIMGQTAVCPGNNPTALCLLHTRTNKQPPFPSFSRNAITTCAFYGSNGTNGN
jgi:hypothetical protein